MELTELVPFRPALPGSERGVMRIEGFEGVSWTR
jgi:hypothetical protein